MKSIARQPKGYTLIEISLVIALILSLSAIGGISVSAVNDWQKGSAASLSLQAVYAGQRSYLADHPTSPIEEVTVAQLIPYLPLGWSEIPAVQDLEGGNLVIDHTVMPPVFKKSSASVDAYDPSGSTSDGLWDVKR